MRTARLPTIALTLALLLVAPLTFGQAATGPDAGPAIVEPTATAPAPRDTFPARLAKALVFGVVVSVLLIGAGLWRRGRRRGRQRPR